MFMLFMFFSFLPLHPFASCLLLSSRILCISLYFNLEKNKVTSLSIHSQRQTQRPVQYQSGMRVTGSHKALEQLTTLRVKLNTRPP